MTQEWHPLLLTCCISFTGIDVEIFGEGRFTLSSNFVGMAKLRQVQ